MRTIGIGLLAAASIFGSTIAGAQTAQQRFQGGAPNWSGGQIGASNGLSVANNGFVEPGAYVCSAVGVLGVNCFETPFSFSGQPLSYTIGPFLGYRWRLGDYVVGAEADWSWKQGSTSSSLFVPLAANGAPAGRSDNFAGSVTQNWDSSFRVRFGFLATASTLVYATGGLALGQINGAFTYSGVNLPASPSGVATANSSWSDVRAGGTVGAGVETELWRRWKLRVEYRYTDYGSYTKTVPVNTVCAVCGSPSTSATINLRRVLSNGPRRIGTRFLTKRFTAVVWSIRAGGDERQAARADCSLQAAPDDYDPGFEGTFVHLVPAFDPSAAI